MNDKKEISFRAWSHSTNTMTYSGYSFNDLAHFFNKAESKWSPIMQYTCLMDMNGEKIFKNDIVKFHAFYFNGSFDNDYEAIGIVKHLDNMPWQFAIKTIKTLAGKLDHKWFDICDTSHLEVPCIKLIGNIYEPPDILADRLINIEELKNENINDE